MSKIDNLYSYREVVDRGNGCRETKKSNQNSYFLAGKNDKSKKSLEASKKNYEFSSCDSEFFNV